MEDKFLYDKKIGWAKLQAKKEGEYGPYEIWSFKVEDDDRYFSIIPGGSAKHKPFTGAKVEMCKYYIEQKGEYTNYKVRELFLSEDTQKPSQTRSDAPQSTISNKDASFYVSYAKDALIAHMTVFPDSWIGVSVDQICEIIVLNGKRMMNMVNSNHAEPSQPDTTAERDGEPPQHGETFSDGTPIPDEPPF